MGKDRSNINFIRCSELEKDLFLVEKKYEVKSAGHGMDITGPFWMLIRVKTLSGKTSWKSGSKFVASKKVVYLYVPPYDWTSEYDEAGTRVEIEGLFSATPPEPHWPQTPCLIYSKKPTPKTFAEVSSFLRSHMPDVEVPLQPKPSGTAVRVKNLLDQKFADDISMTAISRQLKTSSAVISRQFRASYGFPPMAYKRGLRVTVAMFHLLAGKPAAEAAALAGYGDLGRFYKQFKEYIRATPESHRVQKSQKTPGRKNKKRVKASARRRKV